MDGVYQSSPGISHTTAGLFYFAQLSTLGTTLLSSISASAKLFLALNSSGLSSEPTTLLLTVYWHFVACDDSFVNVTWSLGPSLTNMAQCNTLFLPQCVFLSLCYNLQGSTFPPFTLDCDRRDRRATFGSWVPGNRPETKRLRAGLLCERWCPETQGGVGTPGKLHSWPRLCLLKKRLGEHVFKLSHSVGEEAWFNQLYLHQGRPLRGGGGSEILQSKKREGKRD